MKITSAAVACLLVLVSNQAWAEKCLNPDKGKYPQNDRRNADYIECPAATSTNKYGAIEAIGNILGRYIGGDSSPSATEINEKKERINRDAAKEIASRKTVQYGAAAEIGGANYSQWQYANAKPPDDEQKDLLQEINAAVNKGQFLESYAGRDLANADTWQTENPSGRWLNCELATRLVQAYVYSVGIQPSQKNPAAGLAIARTGAAQKCGGTAYWLGRIYEEGNTLVPGVDESDLRGGKDIKSRIVTAYDTAILNGYTPAYERMAALYADGGPERFRTANYFSITDFGQVPFWPKSSKSNERFLTRFGYSKCLEATPGNRACAEGLIKVHSNKEEGADGYTDYSPERAAYYTALLKKMAS